jgi:hypothetical protein
MRKLIAGMKISVDGKVEGPDGTADWVEAWSDDYRLLQDVDACLLGGGMYPGYEQYWTAIRNEPDKPIWITGQPPTPAEREYARFAEVTPHHVLSSTARSAIWPNDALHQHPRRRRRPQAATRQEHLSRRRCPHDREPDRCRVGRRAPAHRLSADCRRGKLLFGRSNIVVGSSYARYGSFPRGA